MIVVADTGPLERVLVPPAVQLEPTHPNTPREVQDWIAAPPEWIALAAPTPSAIRLQQTLGRGETQAIQLAHENNATLLVDDLGARRAAAELHIRITGTLAILALGSRLSLLQFPEVPDRLLHAGFRASPSLISGAPALASQHQP